MKKNNKWKYQGDSRYEKVYAKMQLLDIKDITTDRQHKNGTIVWRLPIKDQDSGILIEVASFKTGYVRNQGKSTRSNFQLNKRGFEDEYFQAYEWKTLGNGDYKQVKIPGQYNKWRRKTCKLIPIEIDRLEYLISYCLKNYYIKRANKVVNGEYIPKWRYEQKCNECENNRKAPEVDVIIDGQRYEVT
jgi:hypothetical protein